MLLDELTGLIGMRHSKILDIHSYQDKLRKATFMSKTRIRMLIQNPCGHIIMHLGLLIPQMCTYRIVVGNYYLTGYDIDKRTGRTFFGRTITKLVASNWLVVMESIWLVKKLIWHLA